MLDEITVLIERGHRYEFLKQLDLLSFQSLADSSERVWKRQMRFNAKQQMISAQGTSKAMQDFDKELAPKEEQIAADTARFKSKAAASQGKG